MNTRKNNSGVLYALAAYASWGMLPLYWKILSRIDALQILSSRVFFSLIFVWILLALKKKPLWPRLLADPKRLRALLLSAILISANWGVYIWAVNSGHTVQASLGYYINPLFNVLLGLIFFKERLPVVQWIAFGLALVGILLLTLFSGVFPWISLILALTFGLYGLAKKTVAVDSLEALGSETLLMTPFALGILCWQGSHGAGAFSVSPLFSVMLVASGIVTAIPLFWFAQGAKRLPLSTLGFVQFVSPTLQLIMGVLLFKEPFPARNLIAFAFVWSGLLLYVLSFFNDGLPVSKKGSNH